MIICFLFILFSQSINAQTKNDDILEFLRLTGTDKLAEQVLDSMIQQYKLLFPTVSNEMWFLFKRDLKIDDLLYLCVPIYSKYYSHDEIKQLIKFYETPLGKKVIRITPELAAETMKAGQEWGVSIGSSIDKILEKKGYY
jgi:hypothetical protein